MEVFTTFHVKAATFMVSLFLMWSCGMFLLKGLPPQYAFYLITIFFGLDDPVLYTVIELVPGMIKVQKVWLGALELPNKKITNEHILAWCQMKLVPDGARDILVC
ncbi:hypothetical protein E2C01_043218 [Portunus trituberculatus]|uniref:Uncharacterized protein n=1 Tax=Portunus trituberculatus TaxID=210409 RepID=A0A5B7FVQ5_PORTR|nr:hypothetical protein [Portunus trituberculatus]